MTEFQVRLADGTVRSVWARDERDIRAIVTPDATVTPVISPDPPGYGPDDVDDPDGQLDDDRMCDGCGQRVGASGCGCD